MMWARSGLGAARLIGALAAVVAGALVLRPATRLLQLVDDARDLGDDCEAGTCSCRWESSTDDGGENVHVTPLRDSVHHTYSEDCVCGPRTEPVFRPDGSNGWLHVHHALDAREATE